MTRPQGRNARRPDCKLCSPRSGGCDIADPMRTLPALVLVLAACGGAPKQPQPKTIGNTAPPPKEEPMQTAGILGVLVCDDGGDGYGGSSYGGVGYGCVTSGAFASLTGTGDISQRLRRHQHLRRSARQRGRRDERRLRLRSVGLRSGRRRHRLGHDRHRPLRHDRPRLGHRLGLRRRRWSRRYARSHRGGPAGPHRPAERAAAISTRRSSAATSSATSRRSSTATRSSCSRSRASRARCRRSSSSPRTARSPSSNASGVDADGRELRRRRHQGDRVPEAEGRRRRAGELPVHVRSGRGVGVTPEVVG